MCVVSSSFFLRCTYHQQVILDVLICNNIGIIVGMLTCRYLFRMKACMPAQMVLPMTCCETDRLRLFPSQEFNWTGLWATKQGKIVRSFVPTSFDEYRWEVLSSWKRFVSVLLLCIAVRFLTLIPEHMRTPLLNSIVPQVSIIELNAFYLKYILWVPPPHPLNIIRLSLWMFMGLPALREYYQFVSDPYVLAPGGRVWTQQTRSFLSRKCKKMGSMTWLCTLVFCTEGLICIKFGRGLFPNPTPPEVFWPWVIFLVSGTIISVIYFYGKESQKTVTVPSASGSSKRKKAKKREASKGSLSEQSVSGEAAISNGIVPAATSTSNNKDKKHK